MVKKFFDWMFENWVDYSKWRMPKNWADYKKRLQEDPYQGKSCLTFLLAQSLQIFVFFAGILLIWQIYLAFNTQGENVWLCYGPAIFWYFFLYYLIGPLRRKLRERGKPGGSLTE